MGSISWIFPPNKKKHLKKQRKKKPKKRAPFLGAIVTIKELGTQNKRRALIDSAAWR